MRKIFKDKKVRTLVSFCLLTITLITLIPFLKWFATTNENVSPLEALGSLILLMVLIITFGLSLSFFISIMISFIKNEEADFFSSLFTSSNKSYSSSQDKENSTEKYLEDYPYYL